MLKVIKRGLYWRIKNTDSDKVYDTKYKSRASAQRKMNVIKNWFKKKSKWGWG